MNTKDYNKLVKERNPQSKIGQSILRSFIVGGIICVLAQLFFLLLKNNDIKIEEAYGYTTMFMIFIGCTLTSFGIYDKIGEFAGAGSIVPVTGFANSVTSPAIEYKKEGILMGTCVKMFTIAGPVIVLGISASVIVGLIHFLFTMGG